MDSPDFIPFVTKLLTNQLAGYRTRDYTLAAAPERNDCTGIGTKPISLQKYQALLPHIIGPNSPLDRLLYIASTGSGKTCSIHAIAAAFGFDGPHKTVVIVPGAPQANEIYKQAVKCPGPIRHKLVDQEHLRWENEADRRNIMRDLNKRFEVLTYIQAGNRLRGNARYFDNRLVFMDEVHNLVDSPEERGGHLLPQFKTVPPNWRGSVRVLYQRLGATRNATIIGLTATPIVDRPEQLLMLLNVLTGKTVVNVDTFRNKYVEDDGRLTQDSDKLDELRRAFRGMLAIYDNSRDFNRFPHLEFEDVDVDYSPAQFTKIQKAKRKETLVNVDPVAVRKASMARLANDDTLAEVSPKFARVLENVMYGEGKQIIFSDQKRSGAEGLLELLLQRGYVLHPQQRAGKGVIYLGNRDNSTLTKRRMEAQLQAFNAADNAKGQHIPIAILSSKYAEGVDFTGVRAVHFVEQQPDPGRFEQVVGRARRFCSHRRLNYPDDWTVRVFTYTSKSGAAGAAPEPDVDNRALREEKTALKRDVLSVAGSVALDCVPNQKRTWFTCAKK